MPGIEGYRAELSRANVRRGWTYDREETIFVGPFVAPGVWVPFKVSRENRVVKGIAIPLVGPAPDGLLNSFQPSLVVNDLNAALLRETELDYVMIRLSDPEGVHYVSDIPARRLIKDQRSTLPIQNLLDGPAPFAIQPMLTAMDGGGAVITDPGLFTVGNDWYLAITFFYEEGR
jgi:hypothetical protein